jgi:hypothetical protein
MSGAAGAVGAGMQNIGSAINLGNNLKAARKKDRILTNNIREQDRAGMESAQELGTLADTLRRSRPDVAGSSAQFASALRGAPRISGPITGSSAFRQDMGNTNVGLNDRSAWMAQLAGQLQAPELQQVRDNEAINRSGERLNAIRSRAGGQDFLAQLRASMVAPNPYTALIGGWFTNTGKSVGSLGSMGGGQ